MRKRGRWVGRMSSTGPQECCRTQGSRGREESLPGATWVHWNVEMSRGSRPPVARLRLVDNSLSIFQHPTFRYFLVDWWSEPFPILMTSYTSLWTSRPFPPQYINPMDVARRLVMTQRRGRVVTSERKDPYLRQPVNFALRKTRCLSSSYRTYGNWSCSKSFGHEPPNRKLIDIQST